ncbi:hypothetical protein ACWEQP_36060 [Streptomyces sp. NPDC004044]
MAVGDVRITSPWQEVTPPPREQVAVRQPSRVPVASLPATFTHRVTGMDGGAFYGSDSTGLMRVRLRYNQRDLSGRHCHVGGWRGRILGLIMVEAIVGGERVAVVQGAPVPGRGDLPLRVAVFPLPAQLP